MRGSVYKVDGENNTLYPRCFSSLGMDQDIDCW